jgi:hypothetical protein
LKKDSVGGDMIFARGDPIEKAHSLAGVNGDLGSRSLERMEAFEG